MKFQSAMVREAAAFANQGLLVVLQPRPPGAAAPVGPDALTPLASRAAVHLPRDDSAHLEGIVRTFGVTILADFQIDTFPMTVA
jgi:hypothetical protein